MEVRLAVLLLQPAKSFLAVQIPHRWPRVEGPGRLGPLQDRQLRQKVCEFSVTAFAWGSGELLPRLRPPELRDCSD